VRYLIDVIKEEILQKKKGGNIEIFGCSCFNEHR
jgi:hypothetical protein